MVIKVTSTMKFDVEKFNGWNNFNSWHIKMHALLVQQYLFKALKCVDNLTKRMDDEEKKDLIEQAHSAIQFYLFNENLRKVIKEIIVTRFWTNLETLYMTKSLINRLYLKYQLYIL